VTIYTNGDPELALKITAILSQKGSHEVVVDARRITRISSVLGSSNITLKFNQGTDRTESFIVHQPATKVNQHLVEQLHLETNGRGDIVTKMPFYQTNVSGVFAAGDSASPFKMIPNAIFQGSNAGAGIARELPRSMTGNEVYRVERIPSWKKFVSW
jgi:thioredoxin reductase